MTIENKYGIGFSPSTLLKTAFLTSVIFGSSAIAAPPTDLFISEYVEGSSYNKAIEIYNGTGATVDLSAYEIQMYFNGNTSAGKTIALSGVIASGGVFVVADSSADPAALAVANQTSGGGWFNGNDAVVLLNGGVVVDSLGQIGTDPGTEWGAGNVTTKDHTLRRMSSVCAGDSDPYNTFDPAIEWDGFATDTFDGLGAHSETCGSGSGNGLGWVINEINADPDASAGDANGDGTVSTTQDEFVELVNDTGAAADISGWTFADAVRVRHTFPAGTVVANGSAIVVFGGGTPTGSFGGAIVQTASTGTLALNNSGDTLALSDGINTLASATYGTEGGKNQSLTLDPDVTGATFVKHSLATGSAGALYSPGTHIDGTAFGASGGGGGGGSGACQECVLIHDIQGSGSASSLVGSTVTIEGVVVGDFQGSSQLQGFFVQEEDGDADANAATSEGIFVYDGAGAVDVNTGDQVRVTATVAEYNGLTELSSVSAVEVVQSGLTLPSAAQINLPFADANLLEQYEGMRIVLPQTLTVSETYNLGRYGQVLLSSGERLMQPTHVALPGADANAVQAQNDLNRILLDDGSATQNPAPIIYPNPGLTATNTLRVGDTVTNVTGVMDYRFGAYTVQPAAAPAFVNQNPRTAVPTALAGTLKVASFNVLNYFNGDGQGGGFPTARGATTASEFTRQRDKIINAIVTMNADIVGLMELENDGYGSNSAINDLVTGLNQAAPVGTHYAFVNPGVAQIGTDQIAVGLIYRTETVTPVGGAAILDSSVDPNFIDTKNRPTLAQTFTEIASGARFTVAVNHLKSKGSACTDVGDLDTGDGQGNCNLTRTHAAQAVVDWLANDPTASGDADFLIIGDLNSYAKEDPITAIKNAGYTDLVNQFLGTNAYSYVFSGQSGYLDHALANGALLSQVTGVSEWHINADEPHVLDYNEEYKTANQLTSLYNADPYRASDHDPVVIGLSLAP